MGFDGLLISEIFHSIQGESSLAGLRFAFIRLTGCNLRCSYCDSTYAFRGGQKMSIEEILRTISGYKVKHALLTGGEPLLQRNTPVLARRLNEAGFEVSIETHGEVSIESVARAARIIMDIKTPSSGMSRGGFIKNLPFLKASDEVKFVIGSEDDYFWAREILRTHSISTREILFSPVIPSSMSASASSAPPGVAAQWLAERILEDRLPVRMQLQLHKLIWGANRTGV